MKVQYSEDIDVAKEVTILEPYRARVRAVINAASFTEAESSMATWQDDLMRSGVNAVCNKLGKVTDVILIGIGGSSLGTEAIHTALKTKESPNLHVLDTVADYKMSDLISELEGVARDDLAVCVISKSGGTTETLSNASVLLEELGELYGEVPYDRVVCIGNEGNHLLTVGEELGMNVLPMHEVVGGRYSVFTSVGLVPLQLLGYDVEALLEGLKLASSDTNEEKVVQGAANLFYAINNGIRNVNYFAFDTRLERLGGWCRQLSAESIGKEEDRNGNKVEIGFVPTISTPVELHSIGQLYFSGFAGVYTDFVSIEDRPLIYYVAKDCKIAPKVKGKSLQEIAYAIEGGVIGAYEERKLPFRRTELSHLNEKELALFMGMRMLETMYLAELMNVNAFDQPNVELYKDKTREILNG